MVIATLAFIDFQQTYRLKEVDRKPYLVAGRERIDLFGVLPQRTTIRLANGDAVTVDIGLGGRTVRSGAKSLDLYKLRDVWLDGRHDSLLGPGKTGNDMRYANSSTITLVPYFDQVIPAGDHALGVLAWRWEKPDRYVHLVRIDTRPALKITPIRLVGPDGALFYPPVCQKIFKIGGKLVLLDGLSPEVISPRGKKLADYDASLPNGYPAGVLDRHWLIWYSEGEAIRAYNLETKQLKVIVKWKTGNTSGPWWNVVDVPRSGSSILVSQSVNPEKFYLAKVPGGQVERIGGPAGFFPRRLQGHTVIGTVGNDICVLDAKTFKTLQVIHRNGPPENKGSPGDRGQGSHLERRKAVTPRLPTRTMRVCGSLRSRPSWRTCT